MSETPPSAPLDARHDQRFPTLAADEIARAARFGERRRFAQGETLFHVGQSGIGLYVLTEGAVVVTRRDAGGHTVVLAHHAPGSIIGETAGLLGRPALVEAVAEAAGEVITLNPAGLRALLVADADLGERITRALILRRVDLIAVGAGGPLLIAPADNAARVGLANFLRRNGWPFQALDPPTMRTPRISWPRCTWPTATCRSRCCRMGRS